MTKPPNTSSQEFQAPTNGDGRERDAPALIDTIEPIAWQGKTVPPRRWLVPGLIPMRNVTLLSGDGGLGKSLLMLQLQIATATGAKWLGQDAKAVKSYGLYCEDEPEELHRRVADICQHNRIEPGDLENMHLASRVDGDNLLADVGIRDHMRPTKLYDELLGRVRDMGAQLVIIDTVSDTFGGNENWRNQVRGFIALMRRIALEIDGAVILTSHPSQAGLNTGTGISGSTGWHNSVRSRLYLTRPKQADEEAEPLANERVLRSMKANYGGQVDDILLTWREGVFVAEEQPSGTVKAIIDRKAERIFLECLYAATEQRRAFSEHKTAASFAPRQMAKMQQASGIKGRDLERAMERLFDAGTIEVGSPFIKPNRHPATGIVRTTKETTNSRY